MSALTKAARHITAHAAAALVNSGDWIEYGAVLAAPDAFDLALAERIRELTDVSIRGCLSVRPRAVVEADPLREHVSFYNWHLSGYDRKQCDAGLQHYIPCNLGEIPDYYRRFIERYAGAIHAIAPEALIFVEPPLAHHPPPIELASGV